MCSDFSCDLFRVEVVLSFVCQLVTKILRSVLPLEVALLFALAVSPPAAMAQGVEQNDGPLGADGTLVPDFERNEVRGQELPAQLPQPRDPLDQRYDGHSSRSMDDRDRAWFADRIGDALPAPLLQLPRDFRDDAFAYRLAQEAQRRRDQQNIDWRLRDDRAFDPLGMRMGSFVFYPEIYSSLITSNNLFASRGHKKSDYGTQIVPRFRLRSDWNNHALEFYASSAHKRWRHFSSENTDTFEVRARGRIDVTHRTSLEGGIRHEQNFEGRGSNELPDAATKPAKTRQTELFGQINHRFNRLGFRFRGHIIDNRFDDVVLNSGSVLNNHQRNYRELQTSLRTNYEFSPRLSLFVDGELGKRVYRHHLDDNGFEQGSSSWLAALGTRLELTSSLSLLGRIGYARANPKESDYVDLQGVIYDANLIWQPSSIVTLTFDGKTEIVETTQSGSPGSFNRSLSVGLKNDWTYRFSTNLLAAYEVRDYAGVPQVDRELSWGMSGQYLLSRSWGLDAAYEHTLVTGTNVYAEDVFRLGLKWQR